MRNPENVEALQQQNTRLLEMVESLSQQLCDQRLANMVLVSGLQQIENPFTLCDLIDETLRYSCTFCKESEPDHEEWCPWELAQDYVLDEPFVVGWDNRKIEIRRAPVEIYVGCQPPGTVATQVAGLPIGILWKGDAE